ncbi:MAG: hypothetical protein KF797_05835 [Flavobacteriales bacterium]|nr:hypothetical protein [Flavobacteriales bacterium]
MAHTSPPFLRALPMAALLLTALSGTAQTTMADVLQKKAPLTWVGLDFSEARFTPRPEFAQLEQKGSIFLNNWNDLLDSEPAKFDIGTPLGLDYVANKTSFVVGANAGFDPAKAFSGPLVPPTDDQVARMVARYPTKQETGAGVVFIVNSFNKTAEMADFTVVFFDMATHTVLHSERIQGKPSGFGLRNFWAGAVHHVLKQIKSPYAKAWRQRYGK